MFYAIILEDNISKAYLIEISKVMVNHIFRINFILPHMEFKKHVVSCVR